MSKRIDCEELKSITSATINALPNNTYTLIGTVFEHPIKQIDMQNLTDVILWFSLDGIKTWRAMPANSFVSIDVSANKSTHEDDACFRAGQGIYVKYITNPPTVSATTFVFVSTLYEV